VRRTRLQHDAAVGSPTFERLLALIGLLLEACPAAQEALFGGNAMHIFARFADTLMPDDVRMEITRLIVGFLGRDVLISVDGCFKTPVNWATDWSVSILTFFLTLHPWALKTAAGVWSVLHDLIPFDDTMDRKRIAKIHFLVKHLPQELFKRTQGLPYGNNYITCLHLAILRKQYDMALVLCTLGGRRLAQTPVLNEQNPWYVWNGRLPLHALVHYGWPFSPPAWRCFFLLVQVYPEGVDVRGGVRARTPYEIARRRGLPAPVLRPMLRALPTLDPPERRRFNYEARREALLVAYRAKKSVMGRLRVEAGDVFQLTLSYL
jgi:hypothetical protein